MSGEFDYQQVVFGKGWDLERSDLNLGGIRLDRALRAIESRPETRTGRILEAGCGVGRFTRPLAAQLTRARIIAFDLSAAAVAHAAYRDRDSMYAVADTISLPYADVSFDAVLFFDLLEHLPEPAAALAEFARVVSNGGLLHGYVPCEGQPRTLHKLLGRWTHTWTARHAGHIHHFDHTQIRELVEQAGFEIVGVQYSYHLLGQALDVATFAAREAIFSRRGGGAERPDSYYDRSAIARPTVSRLYGAMRRVVEAVTYAESQAMSKCRWALGVHITAKRGR